jgi:hypothetical protein
MAGLQGRVCSNKYRGWTGAGGVGDRSPTCLAHWTIFPSFIVDDSAGIATSAFTPAGGPADAAEEAAAGAAAAAVRRMG